MFFGVDFWVFVCDTFFMIGSDDGILFFEGSCSSSDDPFDSSVLKILQGGYEESCFSTTSAVRSDGLGWCFDRVGVVRDNADFESSVLFSSWFPGRARVSGVYVFVNGDDGGHVATARVDFACCDGSPYARSDVGCTRIEFDRYISVSVGDVCFCVYADSVVSQFALDIVFPAYPRW